ncbi:TraR/DksA family transcriptional regulator [Marinobacter caseinilyticus]|uniref:TraR/DksA family transcriptional regulator n=1 Tax=Marinobacter caseinilyticus TaxID=2692195 RepID=UPI00140B5473|nr:TraR/DksA C4-type zinc finger protein [Marinobacter caseinilyticus]
MTRHELARYQATLLQLRAELAELSHSSADAAKPVALDQASVGRLSRMDAMQGQAMAQETERRRKQQWLKIEGALRRIEDNDFGDCFNCGEAIDPRRLAVDPTTTRCIDCEQAT